jgi:membrane protease YdiL (CAAX protease family)
MTVSVPAVKRRVAVHALLDRYRGMIRRHPLVAVLVLALAAHAIAMGITRSRMAHEIAYLTALIVSMVLIDLLVTSRGPAAEPFPVHRPILEILILAVAFVCALVWLGVRFEGTYPPRTPLVRLVLLVLGLGSLFNITVAIAFLALGYSPRALGVRLRGLAPVPLIILCFAALTLVFAPTSVTWNQLRAETGSLSGLVLVALSAAVPEEFSRALWQTRVAATWRQNRAAGCLVATLLWAVLHLPKAYADSHSLATALNGVVHIVPLGLLWGYATIRTQSFVPAVILHSTNIWGLQNM